VAITGFADDATEDIYNGVDSKDARKIPKSIWRVAARKLDMVNAAQYVMDLKAPPGNRLEKLKGDLAGKYSIRVNAQYRIVFSFVNGNASDVQITDYH
jgi:proteic killer suppression protein